MDYDKVYNSIIDRGVERNWSKSSAPCYVERHHIIPKFLGGSDESHNLVYLTAREHYVSHWILSKIYGGKLSQAWFMMTLTKDVTSRYTSHTFRYAKEAMAKQTSEDHIGKVTSEETKIKMRAAALGMSQETKDKISASKKGQKPSKTTIDASILYKKNNPPSKETKDKISKSMTGMYVGKVHDKITCPYCNKTGGKNSMPRWHFDNCKYK